MTSVRTMVARMKREPVRCVYKECRSVTMVALCPWEAKEWALPWSRLDAVSFCHEGESERIELFFPRHHVIMVGENLQEIMDEIRTYEVFCLRNLPASHRAGFGPREVFITRLEVRMLADPKSQSSDGLPF